MPSSLYTLVWPINARFQDLSESTEMMHHLHAEDDVALKFIQDAQEITTNDIDDAIWDVNNLPPGWVTRQQLEITHGAIDNCLNLLQDLMCTRQDPANQTMPEPEPDQAAQDKVDDIMRQPISQKNMDEKTAMMTGILDGKLPWPKEIETQVVKEGEDDSGSHYNFIRLESLRLASQKMQDMVMNYEGAQKEINYDKKKARAGRRSRGKKCKGKSSKSKKRILLKKVKTAEKTTKTKRRRTSVMKKKAEETPEIEENVSMPEPEVAEPEVAMPEIAMPGPVDDIEAPAMGGEEQPEVPPLDREGDDGGASDHGDHGGDDGEHERLDGKALAKKLHSVPWQWNWF